MKGLTTTLMLVLGAAALGALPNEEPAELVYEVTALRGKLLREQPTPKERLELGSKVLPGAVLRTGWWSSAEVSCPAQGAHFRLEPSTRVRLTDDVPGVLLDLPQGRVRAWFDSLGEDRPSERLVTTPSAVLAVKGTEYGVSVSKNGDTTVVVFHGVVEVRDRARMGEPQMVSAGMFSAIRRGQAPSSPMMHGMSPGGFDRGMMPDGEGHASPSGMGSDSQSPMTGQDSMTGGAGEGMMGGGRRP